MNVQKGKQVSIHYTLKVDGKIVDTSRERDPLKYVHGEGQIIPGLSRELEGLRAGERKSVTISPEDGYGAVDPEAFQEVSNDRLPEDIDPEVGMTLQATSPSGQQQLLRITEVKDSSVVVDTNHPLAGKALEFDVEVVAVED